MSPANIIKLHGKTLEERAAWHAANYMELELHKQQMSVIYRKAKVRKKKIRTVKYPVKQSAEQAISEEVAAMKTINSCLEDGIRIVFADEVQFGASCI